MISELGTNLASAQPDRLNKLYDAIGLELRYTPDKQRIHFSTTLRVANKCVQSEFLANHTLRGALISRPWGKECPSGSCALFTRRILNE
jgi:hypothetical protein